MVAVGACMRVLVGWARPSPCPLLAGFAVSAMRKRVEEAPVRPTPKFDSELSQEVLVLCRLRCWGACVHVLNNVMPTRWPLQVLDFFAARGISRDTLLRNRVAQEAVDGVPVIAFPYYRESTLVNIKYRTLDKRFWQVKGAEKILYGLGE